MRERSVCTIPKARLDFITVIALGALHIAVALHHGLDGLIARREFRPILHGGRLCVVVLLNIFFMSSFNCGANLANTRPTNACLAKLFLPHYSEIED